MAVHGILMGHLVVRCWANTGSLSQSPFLLSITLPRHILHTMIDKLATERLREGQSSLRVPGCCARESLEGLGKDFNKPVLQSHHSRGPDRRRQSHCQSGSSRCQLEAVHGHHGLEKPHLVRALWGQEIRGSLVWQFSLGKACDE